MSEGAAESAEIAEIAELSFAPTGSLADQETHAEAARMDLGGLHLGDGVASLRNMQRSTPVDTKSMAGCEFDIYERFVGASDTNLRYSICLRQGVIIGLAFSDPE
jgi:hypothetical protein